MLAASMQLLGRVMSACMLAASMQLLGQAMRLGVRQERKPAQVLIASRLPVLALSGCVYGEGRTVLCAQVCKQVHAHAWGPTYKWRL